MMNALFFLDLVFSAVEIIVNKLHISGLKSTISSLPHLNPRTTYITSSTCFPPSSSGIHNFVYFHISYVTRFWIKRSIFQKADRVIVPSDILFCNFDLIVSLCLATGEGLKVLVEVLNNSSRSIKPKYVLYEKHSFYARGKRKLHTHDLLKEEGEPIEPNSKKTVTKVLSIPPSLTISILNCRILKVEYRLRVSFSI